FLRSFETGNDITREEVGELKNVGTPEELQIVRGSYKYKDPEGNEIVVTYTADENGFVPQGAHFPVPPAIPQEILEALAKNAEEEAKLSEAERAEIDTGRYGYIPIISENFDLNPVDNSYNFNYVTGDGSERHEVGAIENTGTPVEGTAVQGSYLYTAPDGTPVSVNYVADSFGYQPVGPNIHPAIIKAV
ncbi:Endocuticle structural glycoprotein SgAbd-9, partial [Zootermopsis nevadensis]